MQQRCSPEQMSSFVKLKFYLLADSIIPFSKYAQMAFPWDWVHFHERLNQALRNNLVTIAAHKEQLPFSL